MTEISTLRLTLLRAMYLLIALGMGSIIWPQLIAPTTVVANSGAVVRAFLGALTLLCLLGLRYPLQMLPLLLFELLWKLIWVVAIALPLWAGPGLDAGAAETLFEVGVGVILLPLVLPWGYIWRHYVRATATPWSSTMATASPCASPAHVPADR